MNGPVVRQPEGGQEPRAALSRRRFLAGAGGGLAALALAGLAGYEWPHGHRPVTAGEGSGHPSATPLRFVSRPDLKPPRVRVDQVAPGPAGPGYIFLAARTYLPVSDSEPGLMVLDRRGELVWFKPMPSLAPFDLQVQSYRGRPVLTWWQGKVVNGYGLGTGQLAGTHYQDLLTVKAGDGLQADLHELLLTSRGTAFITAFGHVVTDLSSLGGPSKARVLTGHAQEVDLASGKVLMDWDSYRHIGIDETYQRYSAPGPFDYFHINSVAEAPDGNLIISARNTWAIYKIDRVRGDVIWRMNGRRSDFKMGPASNFYWQHDARPHGHNLMTVFDDGGSPDEERRSRGLLLGVDEAARDVRLLRAFEHPAGFIAANQGNVQLLADGRAFVGWGNQPYFTEFSAGGELLLDGELPLGYHSYRAYTQDWAAVPAEPPALAVKANPAGGSVAYASWNGSTALARWVVLAGATAGSLSEVGAQPRTGFETAVAVNSAGPFFAVVALDGAGGELARSRPVKPA